MGRARICANWFTVLKLFVAVARHPGRPTIAVYHMRQRLSTGRLPSTLTDWGHGRPRHHGAQVAQRGQRDARHVVRKRRTGSGGSCSPCSGRCPAPQPPASGRRASSVMPAACMATSVPLPMAMPRRQQPGPGIVHAVAYHRHNAGLGRAHFSYSVAALQQPGSAQPCRRTAPRASHLAQSGSSPRRRAVASAAPSCRPNHHRADAPGLQRCRRLSCARQARRQRPSPPAPGKPGPRSADTVLLCCAGAFAAFRAVRGCSTTLPYHPAGPTAVCPCTTPSRLQRLHGVIGRFWSMHPARLPPRRARPFAAACAPGCQHSHHQPRGQLQPA